MVDVPINTPVLRNPPIQFSSQVVLLQGRKCSLPWRPDLDLIWFCNAPMSLFAYHFHLIALSISLCNLNFAPFAPLCDIPITDFGLGVGGR